MSYKSTTRLQRTIEHIALADINFHVQIGPTRKQTWDFLIPCQQYKHAEYKSIF